MSDRGNELAAAAQRAEDAYFRVVAEENDCRRAMDSAYSDKERKMLKDRYSKINSRMEVASQAADLAREKYMDYLTGAG